MKIMPHAVSRHAAALLSALTLLIGACGDEQDGLPDPSSSAGVGGNPTSSNSSTTAAGGISEGGSGGTAAAGPLINEGFIGGPCQDDQDCDYEGGFCLTEDQGFVDGMCSLDCSQYCPDQTGQVQTFCVNPESLESNDAELDADEGLCTIRCDYGQSPTGCRPGYQCQVHERYAESETEIYVCVPGDDAPFELGSCHQELLELGVAFTPAVNPLDSPDNHPALLCDVEDPIWISATINDVSFRPASLDADPKAIFTACPHGLSMVQTAEELASMNVSDIVHYGVYNCRVISGTNTLSEHGLANAIDIAGLKVLNGAYYDVLGDWEKDEPNPSSAAGKLLKDFVQTLFDENIYNIILTPDYNAAHADHFHCDLTPGSNFLK